MLGVSYSSDGNDSCFSTVPTCPVSSVSDVYENPLPEKICLLLLHESPNNSSYDKGPLPVHQDSQFLGGFSQSACHNLLSSEEEESSPPIPVS